MWLSCLVLGNILKRQGKPSRLLILIRGRGRGRGLGLVLKLILVGGEVYIIIQNCYRTSGLKWRII